MAHYLWLSSLYIVIFNDFVPKLSPWYHCTSTAPVKIDHFVLFTKDYRFTNAKNKTHRVHKVDVLGPLLPYSTFKMFSQPQP